MESANLLARARRAYEVGRLRWAGRVAVWVLPFVAVAVAASGHVAVCLSLGAALLALAVTLVWRGQSWGAAVRPGLVAGAIPFALLLTIKCGAMYSCSLEGCMVRCAQFCAVGGFVAGLLLAARARRRDDGVAAFLVAGGSVAALTGLLGCFVGGLAGALWMALGELAGLSIFGALRARSHKV
jgi:hypothetical protein